MADPVRIKICGVTQEADAELAIRLGADALGLNFYSASPRYLTPERASALLRVLPPFVCPVGLFVNRAYEQMAAALEGLTAIRMLQCHGDELNPRLPRDRAVVVAFPVADRMSLERIDRFLAACREHGQLPAAILVDACVPGQYGGTGHQAPWQLLAEYRPGVPLILAGGLTPDNVAAAIRLVRPYAVDVASGVESSPGRKDPEKLRRFIAAVRDA